MRPFPEASREEQTFGAQDGRDQESESCQERRPRPKEEGETSADKQNGYKLTGHVQHSLDGNGNSTTRSEAGTPPPNHGNHRRVSHKTSSGDSDRSNSPISRTTTPAMYHHPNIAPQHMFDHAALTDHVFSQSPSLPAMHLRHPSPGSTTSLNDRHLEPPPTYEVLQQQNTTLKTRVSELEVINDLFRGRVQELEQQDRRSVMAHEQLRQALDHSKHTESNLKRRIDDLEREVADLRDIDLRPHSKRARISDGSEYLEPPQPVEPAI